jgi:hypothetical protein
MKKLGKNKKVALIATISVLCILIFSVSINAARGGRGMYKNKDYQINPETTSDTTDDTSTEEAVEDETLDEEEATEEDASEDESTDDDSSSETTGTGDAQITLSSNSISVDGQGATADGNKVTISSAGTYNVSGSISDGQIIVDTTDEDKVEITLNDASITCSNSAPINIKSGEVKLFLEGTNSVSDGSSYVYDDSEEEEPNATIFAKDDLTIKGTGELTIDSNFNDAINCKDDLKISEGTINVDSVDAGMKGKDSVEVNGGTITINSQGSGIITDQEDTEKGYVQIDGGSINITSKNDGIKASNLVEINAGTLNISASSQGIKSDNNVVINDGDVNLKDSYEGIEASVIQVDGGNTVIDATDDGINATRGTTNSNVLIEVNGGTLDVTVGNGDTDAFDSNGDITINGGTIDVTAPTSAFDADGTAVLNGGTVTVNGQVITEITPSQQGGGGGRPGGF